MNSRIYVCHTYYHVYISILKELNLPKDKRGEATLLLSKMSTDFEALKDRVSETGVFRDVIEYDEKSETFFPELAKYHEEKGNIAFNMLARIKFTKKLAKLSAPYVPVDFKKYKDIYVFCDADPIGYYLNWRRIPYHAVEDGLDTLVHIDGARFANRGHFKLKAFMSKKLNLIFVMNGYGKYCKDMEVNDIKGIKYPCPYYVEVPRHTLTDNLSEEDKSILLKAFIRDIDTLKSIVDNCKEQGSILLLTEPLCTLDVREHIFRDIIEKYKNEGTIFIKPHPRDYLDYKTLFNEYPQFDATVPMELLNFFPGLRFKKVVGVLTVMNALSCADEVVRLGPDFLDEYEDPLIHRQNELI
ncbi:MAG: glycosyltransferase family 52 protein [Lachnospiraceae bacterium]|nr:glycosyltransferase family 52 protein [Lachnospiraceae bacterium]